MSSPESPEPAAPAEAPAEGPGADTAALGAGYRVQLPVFEGPLDLLLHLIQAHELDIRDIPIAFVAQKYVEYVTLMQELDIDVASEYLVMAATLAHIKSKMLLPAPPEGQDEADEELEADPRAELVRRLLEYQKYKLAAEQLADRRLLGRDVFERGIPVAGSGAPPPFAHTETFALLQAFQAVLERTRKLADHAIEVDRVTITERITEVADLLRARGRVRFEALFEGQHTRAELVVTFLALLEMTRLRMTLVFQAGPLEPLEIELSVRDEGDELGADASEPLGREAVDFDTDESDEG